MRILGYDPSRLVRFSSWHSKYVLMLTVEVVAQREDVPVANFRSRFGQRPITKAHRVFSSSLNHGLCARRKVTATKSR